MAALEDPQFVLEMVNRNQERHDALAPLYDLRHREIFNPSEQQRIYDLLQWLLGMIPGSDVPLILDFGAGTGNLTRQFLKLGTAVVAADVSAGILKELRALIGRNLMLDTMIVNGCDLASLESNSFNMVATYSVLHHVPDYLSIVDEFVRVVKPGGIIYIDHEVCPTFWEDNAEYHQYIKELAEFEKTHSDGILRRLWKVLSRKGCWRYIIAALKQRGNQIVDDGDIHVHKDDHIEWPAIRQRLESYCEIMAENDYLVCRELEDPPPVWSRWRDRCVDMRFIVARKK